MTFLDSKLAAKDSVLSNSEDSRLYCNSRFIDTLELGNLFSTSPNGNLGYCAISNIDGTWTVTHDNITLQGTMCQILAYVLRTFLSA